MTLLLQYLKHYKKILFGALALATVNQVFSLLDPQIFRLIVDRYASKVGEISAETFLRGVLLLLAASVGVALVSRIAKNFQDYFVSVATQRVGARLYEEGIRHSLSLPYAVFEDQRSGELLQRLQKARADSQALIASFVNTVFLSLVGLGFVLVYAFTVHWAIGLAYTLVVPLLGATMFLISRRIKAAQKEIVKETAELAGSTTETLRNVELVKSLGLEQQETGRLNTANDRILGLELKKIRLIRVLSFIQGSCINLTRVSILFLMLWLIVQRAITLGEFFSLFVYSFFVFNPLGELGTVSSQYQETRASMEAFEKILAIPSQPKPSSPRALETLTSFAFRDASFAYGSSTTDSVRGITLEVAGGKTIAFVGPSGSGKTTLVKLILGLYRPTKGRLLFNGTDATLIDYDALRSRIGYVSQETQLFAGTIRENLLFVNPGAADADCIHAMRQASAANIMERGGKGLDTKIGEGGIKISGGERQRLAIARAILRNPDLIIFDEATSSLDSLTEKAITETIRQIASARPNLITILVAHRLSTVSHADIIHVFEKGRVVEKGRHEELLRQGELYAALWREQSGGGNGV